MDKNFWVSLSIVLATIAIGLISFLFYSNRIGTKDDNARCEYNGWAYADQETFDSTDGCNTCFCDDGEVICTEIDCTGSISDEQNDEVCTIEEPCEE